jgi:hypothetical protein
MIKITTSEQTSAIMIILIKSLEGSGVLFAGGAEGEGSISKIWI